MEAVAERNYDDADEAVIEKSLTEVAFELGIHRVTLLRMEQRGVIPKARWRRKPNPHRVYNSAEILEIKKVIAKEDGTDRQFVD